MNGWWWYWNSGSGVPAKRVVPSAGVPCPREALLGETVPDGGKYLVRHEGCRVSHEGRDGMVDGECRIHRVSVRVTTLSATVSPAASGGTAIIAAGALGKTGGAAATRKMWFRNDPPNAALEEVVTQCELLRKPAFREGLSRRRSSSPARRCRSTPRTCPSSRRRSGAAECRSGGRYRRSAPPDR